MKVDSQKSEPWIRRSNPPGFSVAQECEKASKAYLNRQTTNPLVQQFRRQMAAKKVDVKA